MIALKMTDDFSGELEVTVEPSYDDDTKNQVTIKVSSENNESDEWREIFFYIKGKEQLNALITKLVSAKKQL